jgi:hypothetical protein
VARITFIWSTSDSRLLQPRTGSKVEQLTEQAFSFGIEYEPARY